MVIYGVALLSFCMLLGVILGELLGRLFGIDANIGGIGIAMLLLIFLSDYLKKSFRLGDITEKGIRALVIFLTIIALLISLRYEYKYSFIALVALLHDLLLTFSIYVLIGLEITPSTVIALLTILGYSLYDTVILFDKLSDSQKAFKLNNLNKDVLNKTFNEVLMRSINTSLTSAIPIISIIIIGNYLGIEGNLADFAIPLLIGIVSGTYSSIFVTVPFLSKIIKSK